MASVLKISDATALAMHSLVHLALAPETQSTASEIAALFDASKHHVAKVHQRLVRAGLIRSARGPAGGIGLARDPAQITLLEVYEAMEGPMQMHPCLFGKQTCPRAHCALSNLLPRLAAQAHDYFKNTTLAMLAHESKWKELEDEDNA